ncbi:MULTISPECIES: FUSC family protein [unclassified Granulicatella]|uniref:FUSC family protein n=1 Tax=unclassified Granulicatella TaxID=2630493 RepID=UPI0010745D2E|nr:MULTISPECIES: FUSC family protein [unclassified Granulicatella]MBF0780661.1 FUSC family protein [Granulicatella sp. 19428wC4_WM01]TFU94561.1 FUSC family protein [Granulicatella sp. WM01]
MKKYFQLQVVKDNPFRVINISLMLFFILMLGFIWHNFKLSSFASLGLFTYFYYQNMSIRVLMKRLSLIGISLSLSFMLGICSHYVSWSSPLLVGGIACISRFVLRLYAIHKPGALFFAMLSAMGATIQIPLAQLPISMAYVLFGVFLAILIACVTKCLDKRPEQSVQSLPFLQRFYRDPLVIVDAIFYGGALFLSVYISHALPFQNPYWVTLACASVLVAEHLEAAKERHIQYLLGTIIGLGVSTILSFLTLSIFQMIMLITLLYGLAQYFVICNYTVANIFINPVALLLSMLLKGSALFPLIEYRFLNIFIGSLIGLATAWIMSVGLSHYINVLKKTHPYI